MIDLRPTTNHLPELLQRLHAGWSIEEPLLQRSTLGSMRGRQTVIEVVIRKDQVRSVLALIDDPEVYDFLTEHHFAILEI